MTLVRIRSDAGKRERTVGKGDFNTAIFSAGFGVGVRHDGAGFAVPFHVDDGRVETGLDEVIANRNGAAEGELLVVFGAAQIIGVAEDGQAITFGDEQDAGDAAEKFAIFLTEFGAVEGELKGRLGQNHDHAVGRAMGFDDFVECLLHLIQLLFPFLAHALHFGAGLSRLSIGLTGLLGGLLGGGEGLIAIGFSLLGGGLSLLGSGFSLFAAEGGLFGAGRGFVGSNAGGTYGGGLFLGQFCCVVDLESEGIDSGLGGADTAIAEVGEDADENKDDDGGDNGEVALHVLW